MEDKVFDKELFSSLEWKDNLIGVPDFDIEKLKHYLIEAGKSRLTHLMTVSHCTAHFLPKYLLIC